MVTRSYAVLLLLVAVQTSCALVPARSRARSPAPPVPAQAAAARPARDSPEAIAAFCTTMAGVAHETVGLRRQGFPLEQILTETESAVRQEGPDWDSRARMLTAIVQQYVRLAYAQPSWTPADAWTQIYLKCVEDAGLS